MSADLPTPNIPLLRKAVEWAEAEAAKPEPQREWFQGNYAATTECGTAFCIAGWVAQGDPQAEIRKDLYGNLDLYIDGRYAVWHDVGEERLGLTKQEGIDLFSGGNTIEDVRHIAEGIAARAGERL